MLLALIVPVTTLVPNVPVVPVTAPLLFNSLTVAVPLVLRVPPIRLDPALPIVAALTVAVVSVPSLIVSVVALASNTNPLTVTFAV